MAMKLPREQKEQLVQSVQAYFEEERGETIGSLAAEQLLDYVMQQVTPHIYNKAILDVRALMQEKYNQLEDELYTMEKPLTRGR